MEKVAKKKVVRKKTRKTASAAGVEARLNSRIKGLEDTLNGFIDSLNTKLALGTQPPSVETKAESATVQPDHLHVDEEKLPELVEGQVYKFMSPHLGLKILLGGGNRIPIDGYGNYELSPIELADFSELSEGPMGFFKTENHGHVKELRSVIKKQLRKEVVEVTDDPTYAHI